jgi:hypothetical protein
VVGLFALTNIDDDLDLNCGCARSTRDQVSGSARSRRAQVFYG